MILSSPLAFFHHISKNVQNINCRVSPVSILFPLFPLNNCHPFRVSQAWAVIIHQQCREVRAPPQTKRKKDRKKKKRRKVGGGGV